MSSEERLAVAVVLEWLKSVLTMASKRIDSRDGTWRKEIQWPFTENARFWIEEVLGWNVRIFQNIALDLQDYVRNRNRSQGNASINFRTYLTKVLLERTKKAHKHRVLKKKKGGILMSAPLYQLVREDPTIIGVPRPFKCPRSIRRKCNFSKECLPVCYEVTSKLVRVLFIGEAPGPEEQQQGRPFIGQSGKLLRATATFILSDRLKTTPEKFGIAFDNLVHCHPKNEKGGTRAPTRSEWELCKVHLFNTIKTLRPKIIITLGEVPYKYITDADLPLREARGRPTRITIAGHTCWLVPTWHPARVIRDSDLLPEFVEDLYLAIVGPVLYENFPECFRIKKPKKHIVCDTVSKVKKALKKLSKSGRVAVDTETLNTNRIRENKILTIQFSVDGLKSYVVFLDHPEVPYSSKDKATIVGMLKKFFTKPKKLLFHNANFDIHVLGMYGIRLGKEVVVYDTMLFSYLIEENYARIHGKYSLKEIAKRYGYFYATEHPVALKAREEGTLHKIDIKDLVAYGGADACVTYQVFNILKYVAETREPGYAMKCLKLLKYFYSPFQKLIVDIEKEGLMVSKEKLLLMLDKHESPLKKAKEDILKTLYSLPSVQKANRILAMKQGVANSVWGGSKWVFDVNKPEHKIVLFKDVLKVKFSKEQLTKTGRPSLGRSVLKQLAEEGYKEAKLIQNLNKVNKMLNSFIEPMYQALEKDPDCADGRAHPVFHLAGTVTGRLSASNPNCLVGSTLVLLDNIGIVSMLEIANHNLVGLGVDVYGRKGVLTKVWRVQKEEGLALFTTDGRTIKGSLEHRILVLGESTKEYVWKCLKDIEVGDKVPIEYGSLKRLDIPAPEEISEQEAYRLGENFRKKGVFPSIVYRFPYNLMTKFLEGLYNGPLCRGFINMTALQNRVLVSIVHFLLTICGVVSTAFYYPDKMGIYIEEVGVDGIRHTTIRAKKEMKKKMTMYDIEVSDIHCFLANGFISHNSQQIPKVKGDDEFEKRIRYHTRSIFVAPKGKCFCEVDFSTHEVRVLGIFSKDPLLKKNFENYNKIVQELRKNPSEELVKKLEYADPHRVNASYALGIPPEKVSKEQRGQAKGITFGSIYGMAIESLARNLGISVKEAEEIFNRIFSKMKKAKKYLDWVVAYARYYLRTVCPNGRTRHLWWYLLPKAYSKWSKCDRLAKNNPIQGYASDLAMMSAFLFKTEVIDKYNLDWKIVNLVHDSNLFVIPIEDIRKATELIPDFYTTRVAKYVKEIWKVETYVPLGVDLSFGKNLADTYEWDWTPQSLEEIIKKVKQEDSGIM